VFVAFLCGLAFSWPNSADVATFYGAGEPLTLQGASIWPTILLRSLGIVLSIGLIWQVLHQGAENLKAFSPPSDLALPDPADVKIRMSRAEQTLSRFRKLLNMFSYQLAQDSWPEDKEDQPNHKREKYELERAWERYVYSGRLMGEAPELAHSFL
jgi:hypothetical protein